VKTHQQVVWRRWSVTKLASITFLSLVFSYWIYYLGFITEGRLAAVLIIPSLGVPNWSVIYIINTAPSCTKATQAICRSQGEIHLRVLPLDPTGRLHLHRAPTTPTVHEATTSTAHTQTMLVTTSTLPLQGIVAHLLFPSQVKSLVVPAMDVDSRGTTLTSARKR
jgi:hypothetical protein